jgi:selenium-dependent xanthine dehydrogenase
MTHNGSIELAIQVNGQPFTVEIASDAMLVDVLRGQLGLLGVKVGCGEGECGACTVLLDGEPVASCVTPAIKAYGSQIITVEGLASPEGELDPVQKAFLAEGAVQCGFCTPGMLMAAKALLLRNPSPSEREIRAAFTGHLCRCTGYHAILRAVRRAAEALSQGTEIELDLGHDPDVVGRAVVRKDGVAKVTGAHRFGADHRREGELHAVAVWSAHPHADLLSLDTSRALALEGVVAVLTAEDVPGQNAHGIIIPHQPVFVAPGGRIRSISDVLALVVAESEALARAATEMVVAEYRLLEGVFTPREALKPGAPILHPPRPGDEPSNVMYGTHVEKGSVEAAMAGADIVLEGCFRTPFIEHAYLEPEAGRAEIDDDGVVTVKMASQAVAFHHRGVSAVLDQPLEKVRLVHVSPGGGFGARNDLSLHPYLALAAFQCRRPVKMVLTRAESLRFHTKRHAMEHTVRLAADRDGQIVALTCDILADTGAYSSAGIPVLDQATLFATGPYDIANVRIKGLSVYTNNVACGAMRGFGIPQSAFAVESLMDDLAVRLGMSPFKLRRLNGLKVGSSTATGQVLKSSVPYLETLDLVEGALAEAERTLPPPAPGHKRGVGVASCYKNVGLGLGLPEPTGVGIDLTAEGRILVRFGGAELGQGADTVVAQMAAQALRVPYALVDILSCDTARTPDGGITSASRTTFMSGNAVIEAAPLFLERLHAAMPGTTPTTRETLAELAKLLQEKQKVLSVDHVYIPPPTFALEAAGEAESTKFISFSYATQAAIVDVDKTSGEVFVRKMIAVHDVGHTINPHGAQGQIEGSCLMGLGYAISEEFVLDRGYLATDTLAKVGIPVMQDAPPIDVRLLEDPDPLGPYGAKGIAEAAAIPTAPAILNAVYHATGVRIRQLPATPDRVFLEWRTDAATS